jgi:hypothetical protein
VLLGVEGKGDLALGADDVALEVVCEGGKDWEPLTLGVDGLETPPGRGLLAGFLGINKLDDAFFPGLPLVLGPLGWAVLVDVTAADIVKAWLCRLLGGVWPDEILLREEFSLRGESDGGFSWSEGWTGGVDIVGSNHHLELNLVTNHRIETQTQYLARMEEIRLFRDEYMVINGTTREL